MNKSSSGTITVRRKVGTSTTLNRKYVSRPSSKISAEKAAADYQAERLKKRQALAEKMNREANAGRISINRRAHIAVSEETKRSLERQTQPKAQPKIAVSPKRQEQPIRPAEKHPVQVLANQKIRARKAAPVVPIKTAAELKEEAIRKALTNIARDSEQKPEELKATGRFGFGRILLALACATASIFAIVYLVNLNMPDFSLRVAAMQTGIEAKYPNYVPADYSLNGITSENGKVTIAFVNKSNNHDFKISEENSSWDSTALLTNYVRKEFNADFVTIKEQGLTIYFSSDKAAWVNGGVVYKISFTENSLTKNQVRSIATSL